VHGASIGGGGGGGGGLEPGLVHRTYEARLSVRMNMGQYHLRNMILVI
jgi:hypothetical protein